MFSFNSLHPGLLRRLLTRSIFALFLVSALLFIGCSMEEEEEKGPSLHGSWLSAYDERYNINLIDNTLEHDYLGDYPFFAFKGTIHEIIKFNSNGTAGIIFIEYTDKNVDWNTTGGGNFTGIHFKNLTNRTGEFSNAADGYFTPTAISLEAAKLKFTVDTVGEYFGMTSACVKQ